MKKACDIARNALGAAHPNLVFMPHDTARRDEPGWHRNIARDRWRHNSSFLCSFLDITTNHSLNLDHLRCLPPSSRFTPDALHVPASHSRHRAAQPAHRTLDAKAKSSRTYRALNPTDVDDYAKLDRHVGLYAALYGVHVNRCDDPGPRMNPPV